MQSAFDVIEITDPLYPAKLRKLKKPPKSLYIKGDFSSAKLSRCVAVVGSRRCTQYSDLVLQRVLPELVYQNITIVSGFMFGVDAKAHQFCIENSGVTIGVLPYGINFEPPRYMANLYDSILKNGGVLVSEYPDKQPPEKWTFIARNRIIAGLCLGVLVVEAGEASGSLYTVNFAREVESVVFSVPGSILSSNSVGTNELIKKGAVLVTSSSDILYALGLRPSLGEIRSNRLNNVLGGTEASLLKIIKLYPGVGFDFLLLQLQVTPTNLNANLASLLLRGCIKELQGKYYAVEN